MKTIFTRYALSLVIISLWAAQPAQAGEGFVIGTQTKLGPEVNSSANEFGPAISADGLSLYFFRRPQGDIYVARREKIHSPWGNAQPLDAPINTPSEDVTPYISPDNQMLYFASRRAGGSGGRDIWVSTWDTEAGTWGEPTNLGEPVNSSSSDFNPYVSADGLSLYFQSLDRPGGSGASDIWVTRRNARDEPWAEPENLGPHINGPDWETSPSVTGDDLMLFFTSVGTLLISTRERVEDPWGPRVRLGVNVDAIGPEISYDGSMLYFAAGSPRDLWQVPLLPLEGVSLRPGSTPYAQNFDEALGVDGSATGTNFPAGWTTSENGVVFHNTTMQRFPAGSRVRQGTYNAGAENDPDRALAIGVTSDTDQRMLQLLADVTTSEATALELKFDIEAWDARSSRVDLPGEAAFDVNVEVDTGDGFAQLLKLGTVTTGANLSPSTGDFIDGNADANRATFDSGIQAASIPASSQLRVRWSIPAEAETTGWIFGLDNVELKLLAALRAGDANQDYDFDQLDLVQVQTAAKYLTGQSAIWGEGDWNGAPGGYPGSPPAGDGLFNQLDIVAAQQGAAYLAGPYAAIAPGGQAGDAQTSLVYDPGTGELAVDAPAGTELTSINIDSAAGIFTGSPAESLGGSFDNDADNNIFKATFGSSFGSLSFGNVAQPGLAEEFLLSDLTVVGSLAGGGDLGNVDLVYVPEPATGLLLVLGAIVAAIRFRAFAS